MTNLEIVEREFELQLHKRGLGPKSVKAYEAPAAESWIVIADGVAWIAVSDREDFVFWGPKGLKPISFELPEDWKY